MPETHTVENPVELFTFLLACRRGVKGTTVRQWLKHGTVEVNGRAVTHSKHLLQKGDRITLLSKQESRHQGRLPRGMTIVFEDNSLIVIEKPVNLLSVASASESEKTAYAFLMEYVTQGNRHSRQRVWVVHRLDRETSGVMVFAKTEGAQSLLQANWQQVSKRYLAVVEGHPPADAGVLRSHLDETHPYKVFSSAPSNQTRLAVTHYRVMRRTTTRTLVELTLETGRRNQIRVQLADADCPIVGDPKYGAQTNPARRLALHASALQFQHPSTREALRFESPLPPELARLVGTPG